MVQRALRFEGKNLPRGPYELGKPQGVRPDTGAGLYDRHSRTQDLREQLVLPFAKLPIEIKRPANIMIIAEKQHRAVFAALEPYRRTFKDDPRVHSTTARYCHRQRRTSAAVSALIRAASLATRRRSVPIKFVFEAGQVWANLVAPATASRRAKKANFRKSGNLELTVFTNVAFRP